jgi:hypothetical protein
VNSILGFSINKKRKKTSASYNPNASRTIKEIKKFKDDDKNNMKDR